MNHSADIRRLFEALAGVSVNGQALAAADLCIGTVTSVRDQMAGWFASISPDRSLADAATRLTGAIADVQSARSDFAGADPGSPIDAVSWDNLSHAIGRAYNTMWAVEDVQGDVDTRWAGFFSWAGSTIAGSVAAMPGVISSAVGYAGDLATKTAGGVISGAVIGLWPVLLIAGGVVVAAVLLLGAPRVAGLAKGAVT